jgi:hypothetical protein
MDCSSLIRIEHLRAALALWEYSERSVRFVFGEAMGDAVADDIANALRSAPVGMTREEIRNLFQRNRPAAEIDRALGVLLEHRLAHFTNEQTAGRPATRWFAGAAPLPRRAS